MVSCIRVLPSVEFEHSDTYNSQDSGARETRQRQLHRRIRPRELGMFCLGDGQRLVSVF